MSTRVGPEWWKRATFFIRLLFCRKMKSMFYNGFHYKLEILKEFNHVNINCKAHFLVCHPLVGYSSLFECLNYECMYKYIGLVKRVKPSFTMEHTLMSIDKRSDFRHIIWLKDYPLDLMGLSMAKTNHWVKLPCAIHESGRSWSWAYIYSSFRFSYHMSAHNALKNIKSC